MTLIPEQGDRGRRISESSRPARASAKNPVLKYKKKKKKECTWCESGKETAGVGGVHGTNLGVAREWEKESAKTKYMKPC